MGGMIRTFFALLAYGFRKSPRKTLATVLDIFQTHPVAAYQLVVLLRFPSWWSALAFILGAFANHLFVNLTWMAHAGMVWMRIRAALEKLEGCTVRTFTPQEYLPGEYGDIDFWLVKKLIGPHASLNQMVHVHVVKKPRTVIPNLSAYAVPMQGAHIFLADAPGEIRGIQRFAVLHEIGHAMMRTYAESARMVLGIRPYLFLLAWFACTAVWSRSTVAGALAFSSAMMVWNIELYRLNEGKRLIDELAADSFALGYMSPEDCRRAAANRRLPELLDPDLPPLHNAVRVAHLKKHLERGSDEIDEELLDSMMWKDSPDLGSVIAALLAIGALGLFAREPSGHTVLWFLAVCAVLFALFFTMAMLQHGFRRALQAHLASLEPA